MANEKINHQEIIVDTNELSDNDLEQATGGTGHAAVVHDASGKYKSVHQAVHDATKRSR